MTCLNLYNTSRHNTVKLFVLKQKKSPEKGIAFRLGTCKQTVFILEKFVDFRRSQIQLFLTEW